MIGERRWRKHRKGGESRREPGMVVGGVEKGWRWKRSGRVEEGARLCCGIEDRREDRKRVGILEGRREVKKRR